MYYSQYAISEVRRTRTRHDAHDKEMHDNRQRICSLIECNPGIYLRRVSRDLMLPMGLTQYHLNILQREGRIRSLKLGMYRHFFLIGINDEKREVALAFLVHQTSRDILVYLIQHSGSSQGEIARFKQMSSPTISWYMSKLMSAGVVISIRDGRTVRYFIHDISYLIYVLRSYYPAIWNNIANKIAEEVFIGIASQEKSRQILVP